MSYSSNNQINNNEQADLLAFETGTLQWVRSIAIFLVLSLALYHFTPLGRGLTILALLLNIFLFIVYFINYSIDRNKIIEKGYPVKITLDLLSFGMLVGLIILILALYGVFNDYNYDLFNELGIQDKKKRSLLRFGLIKR